MIFWFRLRFKFIWKKFFVDFMSYLYNVEVSFGYERVYCELFEVNVECGG